MAALTGATAIAAFEAMVEDSMDTDLAYQLMNDAKDEIEAERDWLILQTFQNLAATTAARNLPDDYVRTVSMYVGTQPYMQIPFHQKHLFASAALRWYLDMKNDQYYLLGSSLNGTINHCYIYKTPDIEPSTSPVWPSQFHMLLPFKMAEIFYAVDGGDRIRAWDDKWTLKAASIRRRMIDWDVNLQKRAVENGEAMDYQPEFELAMM